MATQPDRSRLLNGALQLADFLADADPAHGGEVLFAGRVRNIHEGRAVTSILYHAHRPLAEARLAEIEAETERRFGVRCRLAHAIGELAVGEISVIVAIQGGHREETFTAARWAIDTVKSAVPVWKEEHYADGSIEFVAGQPIREVTGS
jgi:Molybdopterin converting factor, large subunit